MHTRFCLKINYYLLSRMTMSTATRVAMIMTAIAVATKAKYSPKMPLLADEVGGAVPKRGTKSTGTMLTKSSASHSIANRSNCSWATESRPHIREGSGGAGSSNCGGGKQSHSAIFQPVNVDGRILGVASGRSRSVLSAPPTTQSIQIWRGRVTSPSVRPPICKR